MSAPAYAEFMMLAVKIDELHHQVKESGQSRELSLALTKLDEARLWISEHVAVHCE